MVMAATYSDASVSVTAEESAMITWPRAGSDLLAVNDRSGVSIQYWATSPMPTRTVTLISMILYLARSRHTGEWYPITPYYFKIQLRLNPIRGGCFPG
jgi:hypothetical protein